MTDFSLIFSFLQELSDHNEREWFRANKPIYEQANAEFKKLTELLILRISSFDSSIAGLQPKDCIFRLNRDTRFSHDKTPYKINFGCFMVPGGRNAAKAGYYLHLQPGSSFLAGGVYMPPPIALYRVRNQVYNNINEFIHILNEPGFVQFFNKMDGEMLKRSPRDFPAEFEHNELLRYKSYTITHPMSDDHLFRPDYLGYIESVFSCMKSFIMFINRVL